MSTTRELISDIIELEEDKEFAEDNEVEEINTKLVVAKKSLSKKVESLDWFINDLDRRNGSLDGEINVLQKEVTRLKKKKKAVDKIKQYISNEILPMVVKTMGNNGLFETEVARYKLYETYGPVEVDMENCHKDFVKTEIIVKPNKVLARKKAIEADRDDIHLDGISISKVEKVRRS